MFKQSLAYHHLLPVYDIHSLLGSVVYAAALSVGAVRAGVRRARGLSDGSESPDS